MGARGATLKAIEEQSGARITVEKGAGAERAVRVGGSSQAVAKARALIDAAVRPEKPQGRKVEPHAKGERIRITIFAAQVAALVGERGATVRAIEELSGSTIAIQRAGHPMRAVEIRAPTVAQLDEARDLIEGATPIAATVDVRAAQVGTLLGYRGETIREIEARSQCTLSVPREGAVRTVVVCGPTEAAVRTAERAIADALCGAR